METSGNSLSDYVPPGREPRFAGFPDLLTRLADTGDTETHERARFASGRCARPAPRTWPLRRRCTVLRAALQRSGRSLARGPVWRHTLRRPVAAVITPMRDARPDTRRAHGAQHAGTRRGERLRTGRAPAPRTGHALARRSPGELHAAGTRARNHDRLRRILRGNAPRLCADEQCTAPRGGNGLTKMN